MCLSHDLAVFNSLFGIGVAVCNCVIILCLIFFSRRKARKEGKFARWVTLEIYSTVILIDTLVQVGRGTTLIFFSPGASNTQNYGTVGKMQRAFFVALIFSTRNLTPVGIFSYVTKNSCGTKAIRYSLLSGLAYVFYTAIILTCAFFLGTVDQLKETWWLSLLFDTSNLLVYIYFAVKVYVKPIPRIRKTKAYIRLYLFCRIVNSLCFFSGTISFRFFVPQGDRAAGFCFYMAGDYWGFLTEQICLYLTMVDDSQYWRGLGSKLQRAEFSKRDSKVLPLIQNHVFKGKRKLTLSPLENLEVTIVDFTRMTILNKLGTGAHGTVYKSHLFGMGDVAAKLVIDKVKDMTSYAIGQFCREAVVSRNFFHENIVQFLGICIHPPRLFLIYELCHCGDLRKYILTPLRKIPLASRISIVRQATAAVSYMHDRDFVHRDIKTENFLLAMALDGRLIVKLADFGTTRVRYEGDHMKFFTGTLLYMAPELILHFPADMDMRKVNYRGEALYDDKVDIWSLAVTAWEILARRAPYFHTGIISPRAFRRTLLAGSLRCKYDMWPEVWQNFFQIQFSSEPEQRWNARQILEWLSETPDLISDTELSLVGKDIGPAWASSDDDL